MYEDTLFLLDAEHHLLGSMSRDVSVHTHTTHAQLSFFSLSNSCALLSLFFFYHLLALALRYLSSRLPSSGSNTPTAYARPLPSISPYTNLSPRNVHAGSAFREFID